ncbi:hypothetical protein CGRA01v4_08644 [Colletotrichum graminicola]|nr:hypothetical protein CGRA01v4_08644 [Colletotrichum graminicola]
MEKYHSVHEEDISSFDLPSTHRLPTVSAADALEDLDGSVGRHISTGIDRLDETLVSSFSRRDSVSVRGGLQRGQVSEIWGPPGSGKTALGIQLVASALCDGHGAVWVGRFILDYDGLGKRMMRLTMRFLKIARILSAASGSMP